MRCRVCNKELIMFDDIIYQCKNDVSHKTTNLIQYSSTQLDFELIKINSNYDRTWFGFEINHLANFSQITKITIEPIITTDQFTGSQHIRQQESTNILYHQKGIMDIDFSSLEMLIDKLERLEIFS